MSTDGDDYESARRQNIERNRALLKDLGLDTLSPRNPSLPTRKKRKIAAQEAPPQRTSARLANARQRTPASPTPPKSTRGGTAKKGRPRKTSKETKSPSPSADGHLPPPRVSAIVQGWTQWAPSAPEPTRDEDGIFHFPEWPSFTPNKSPAEMLREGCFGGSYFRPLRSKRLGVTVQDDWHELPGEWLAGLDVQRYVCGETYEPSANKFGVSCGQSIEEWEANGWIAHEHDVRGWFQWYCRFFRGRRCDDDDRQVGRWARCVGPRGRWRRALLRQYVKRGVRSVLDEEGGEGGDAGEVSPVVSQTCFHWAWEVRQADLDAAWSEFG